MSDVTDKHLERLKAVIIQCLSPEMIVDVAVADDSFWGELYKVRIYVSLLGILESVEEFPIDWWQAVRQRWAPRWWIRRHPVKIHTVKIYGALYMKPSDDPFWDVRQNFPADGRWPQDVERNG